MVDLKGVTDTNKRKTVKMAMIVLIMEAESTPETSVNLYQTTRRYNPEDSPPSEPQILTERVI
jgi:hypothetical protein